LLFAFHLPAHITAGTLETDGGWLDKTHTKHRRAKRDWRDQVSDQDETVLCSFQFELEQGLLRFEEAKAAGELGKWPPRTLHPTQGLPAIDAAFKAWTMGPRI
jgi:hypothetical protein